jgi:hypothetical protein
MLVFSYRSFEVVGAGKQRLRVVVLDAVDRRERERERERALSVT